MTVVIPSVGRPAVLHETVISVLDQRHRPLEIILSVPGLEHVEERTRVLPGVRCVQGTKGLCAQRNSGIRAAVSASDLVVFFDDDVELDSGYLSVIAEAFDRHPEIVVANGQLLADGGPRHRLTRADARTILAEAARDQSVATDRRISSTHFLYGCHFAVRKSVFESVRFDERLPFYGWLEDLDFGRSCERLGRVCVINGARMVHLAERSGRTSGLRFGYSQIMNPAYMRTKGTCATMECTEHWCRALATNFLGMVLLSRPKRERLTGNLIALSRLLRGKIDPEYIVHL